jgi:hypothetical protein
MCQGERWGGADAGALYLSCWPNESSVGEARESGPNQDRHKTPSHPRIRPLSLQDGDRRIPDLARYNSLSRLGWWGVARQGQDMPPAPRRDKSHIYTHSCSLACQQVVHTPSLLGEVYQHDRHPAEQQAALEGRPMIGPGASRFKAS